MVFLQCVATVLLSLSSSLPLAPNDGSASGTTTAQYANLLTWLNTTFPTSYVNPSLSIAPTTIRGLGTKNHGGFTTAPLSKNDLILRIPREACLTSIDVLNDPDCGEIFQKINEKSGPGGLTVCFAGFLAKEYLCQLSEYGTPSRFGPYLTTLPWKRNWNDQEHILFWTEEEVQSLLRESLCWRESEDLRSEVRLAKKVLNSVVGPSIIKARMSEAEREREEEPLIPFLKWTKPPPKPVTSPVGGLGKAITGAFVILLTRAFDESNDDNVEGTDRLIPVLDMLNHSNEPTITHKIDPIDGSVEVRARGDIEAGEELFNRYREEEEMNMPYHRFFSRFGFVPGVEEDIRSLLEDQSSIFFPKRSEV